MADFVIICAMQDELNPFLQMTGAAKNECGDYTAVIGENRVFCCQSGVGKVNAACAVQRAVMLYKPEAVINFGISGALEPTLSIAETVVCDNVKYHDFSPAEVLTHVCPYCLDMRPDTHLTAKLAVACENQGRVFRLGTAVSGDMIVSDAALAKKLNTELGGTCVDMETCAVAHACIKNNVKFAVLRGISDFADEDAIPQMDRTTYIVSRALGEIVIEALK